MDTRADDRSLISDLVVAYAYAVDESDWSAFESLFVPGASIDYRSSGGIAGTPSEVAAWMPGAMALFSWSMHSISTHRLEFTDERKATGSLHAFARHGLTWEGVDELMDVNVIYRDEYLRTDNGWLFASRREDTLHVAGGRFAELVTRTLPG